MSELTKQQTKEFLNKISSKDSVAIIHHDDADGFCSGIIFHDHCISKKAKVKTFSYDLSKSNLEKLQLQPFNKIIITDISTKAIQKEIKSIKDKTIFLTDHHPKFPLPKEILSFLTANQGYIPSSRTAYELTKIKKWLAVIGTISDAGDLYKENKNFIDDFLKNENLTLKEFKTKYSHTLSDTIVYFAKTPEKVFSALSKIKSLEEIKKLEKYAKEVEKEIEKSVRKYKENKENIGNVDIYQIESKFQIKGIVSSILGRKNPDKTIILLSKKISNPNFLGISARSQAKNANLPKLLETATRNLKNAESGGHPRASGGQIQTKDLKEFKQNIRNYIKNIDS